MPGVIQARMSFPVGPTQRSQNDEGVSLDLLPASVYCNTMLSINGP